MTVGERPRPLLLLVAGLALQALLLLWPATFGGEVFFRRDVHLMWTAQSEALARARSEGAWPLWNPLVSFGQPLLADANSQVLYPPSLLRLFLAPWHDYTLYAFAHLVFAGVGAAILARRLGLGWFPSWGAGAVWSASGPLLSLVDTWNQLAGAAWMPWAIAAALAAVSRLRVRPALAWATCTAMQVLAGAPETVVLSGAGFIVIAAAKARRRHVTRAILLRVAGGALLSSALALGLAAAQWVPALDAARRAGRTDLPREARTHWSVHPANLAQTVCPLPLHRLALRAEVRQWLFGAPDPFLPSLYVGAVAAALAASGIPRAGRTGIGLAAALLLSTLAALGRHSWVYDALIAVAPPLRAFRYPAKALLLASLAWSLLCAFGLAALGQARRRWPSAAVAFASAVVCAAVAARAAMGPEWLDGLLLSRDASLLPSFAVRLGLAALLAAAG